MVAIKRHHFYPWLAPGEYQQCHFSSSLECAKQELSPAQTGAIRSSLGSLPPLPVTKSLAWNSKHYSQITSTSITGVPIGFSTVLIWVFLDFCIGRAPWSIWQSLLHLLLCYSPSQEICHSLQAAVAAAREAAITCISKALHKKSKKRYWETESFHCLHRHFLYFRWQLLSPEYLWAPKHSHSQTGTEWCEREWCAEVEWCFVMKSTIQQQQREGSETGTFPAITQEIKSEPPMKLMLAMATCLLLPARIQPTPLWSFWLGLWWRWPKDTFIDQWRSQFWQIAEPPQIILSKWKFNE